MFPKLMRSTKGQLGMLWFIWVIFQKFIIFINEMPCRCLEYGYAEKILWNYFSAITSWEILVIPNRNWLYGLPGAIGLIHFCHMFKDMLVEILSILTLFMLTEYLPQMPHWILNSLHKNLTFILLMWHELWKN